MQKLFTYILLETQTNNWKDLQNMTIKKKTWISIANHLEMPNINSEQLKYQWRKLSTMLFCEKRIEYSEFKLVVLSK